MADNIAITAGAGTTIATDEVGSAHYQYVKPAFGVDGTATIVSTTNPLPTVDPDSNYSGTITVTDSVVAAPGGAGAFVSGASTSGSLVSALTPGGDSAWCVQVTGLTSGTLYYEGSLDSTNGTDGNWININGRQTGVLNTVLAGSATSNGLYRGNTSGLKYFRVRSVGALTGTPAIVIRITSGAGAVFLNASIPGGTNAIGQVFSGVVPSGALRERVTNTDGASTASSVFGATASQRNCITTISVHNSSATNGFVDLRDGTGGTVLFTIPLPAGGGAVVNLPVPLTTSANTALAFDVSAALSTVYLSFVGYKSAA